MAYTQAMVDLASMPWFPWLLAAALAGVAFCLWMAITGRRDQALAWFAAKRGYGFDAVAVDERVRGSADGASEPLDRQNVIHGERDGVAFVMFDECRDAAAWQDPGWLRRGPVRQTVVAIRVPTILLPTFRLTSPMTVTQRSSSQLGDSWLRLPVADHDDPRARSAAPGIDHERVSGALSVDAPQAEACDVDRPSLVLTRGYRLEAENRFRARAFLDAAMRDALPVYRGWSVEAEGPWLRVYCLGHRVRPSDAEAMIARAFSIYQAFDLG